MASLPGLGNVAKITITLEDKEDQTVSVSFKFKPSVDTEQELTAAQAMAVDLIDFVKDQYRDEGEGLN